MVNISINLKCNLRSVENKYGSNACFASHFVTIRQFSFTLLCCLPLFLSFLSPMLEISQFLTFKFLESFPVPNIFIWGYCPETRGAKLLSTKVLGLTISPFSNFASRAFDIHNLGFYPNAMVFVTPQFRITFQNLPDNRPKIPAGTRGLALAAMSRISSALATAANALPRFGRNFCA